MLEEYEDFGNRFIDLEEELKSYENEIYEKYFFREEGSKVVNLIRLYDGDLEKAEKAYVGMLPIGFCTNSKVYNQKVEIRNQKKCDFKNIVIKENLFNYT